MWAIHMYIGAVIGTVFGYSLCAIFCADPPRYDFDKPKENSDGVD